MSEPKRYTDLQVWEALHFAGSTNGWIRWQDYARLKADAQVILKHLDEASADCARLKAEVERLRASSFVTAVPVEQYERVIKAGDAMALSLANADRMEYGDPSEPIEGYMNREVIKAWNAAKEGKQP